MFPRKQSATQPDHTQLKINMDILQRMTKLRPYHVCEISRNAILKDLESQLVAKAPIMKLADYIAFADGMEGYMRKKGLMPSRGHYADVAIFKSDMNVLWNSLDDNMQERLLHEPIYEIIMRESVNKALPSGGHFSFE